MKVLFIGGTADGQRRGVGEQLQDTYAVSTPPEAFSGEFDPSAHQEVPAPIKSELYRLQTLRDGRHSYYVYVLDDGERSLIRALLDGYRRA